MLTSPKGRKRILSTGVTMVLMLLAFFSWWYGRGWKEVADSFAPRLNAVINSFSVRQLLRTLFSPWKRIITRPGRSLEDKLRAWADNAFSRVIGFIVRFFVLIGALLSLLVVGILTTVELLAWPLVPLAIPGFIVVGLMQ